MNDNPFRFGQRPAGFRILASDTIVAFVAIAVALFIWYWAQDDKIYQTLAFMPLVILGHFFLFCNVFRVSRKLELIWGIIFILASFADQDWLYAGHRHPGAMKIWLSTIIMLSPITVAILIWAIFTEDYHGIGYRLLPWGRKIIVQNSEEICVTKSLTIGSEMINKILDYELAHDNFIHRVDESWRWAIVMAYPLRILKSQHKDDIDQSVEYWECRDGHYEIQSGYTCEVTKESIVGPLTDDNIIFQYDMSPVKYEYKRVTNKSEHET